MESNQLMCVICRFVSIEFTGDPANGVVTKQYVKNHI